MKKKFSRSSVFVVSAMVLLMALFAAGCQKKENTGNDAQDGGLSNDEKVTSLSMFIRERWAGVGYDNFSTRHIQDITRTKWDVKAMGDDGYSDQLSLVLASGERPDIIQFGSDEEEQKFVEAGLLLPLNQYIESSQNLKDFPTPGTWDAMKHEDGNIYAIPIQPGGSVDLLPIYRKDWLDYLGMDVPQTIDEYYDVAVAMSNTDFDGSGKKVYAIGSNGLNVRYFDHIFSAFGAQPMHWGLVDGKIANGSVQPGVKEAIKFINKLFLAGAIDPEFITDNADRVDDKFKKGLYGAMCFYYFVFDTDNLYNYYVPFKENNPDGEWIEGGILTGASDHPTGLRALSKRGWLKTAILKDSKNVDGAIRLFDYLTSKEGQMFVNYGVEGTDYTIDNGVVKELTSADEQQTRGITQTYLAQFDLSMHYSLPLQRVIDYAYSLAEPNPADGLLVPELSYTSDLNDYTRTQFMDMIVGKGSIDDKFDNFVKEWNKRGGDKLTAALDAAYQAMPKQ